MPVRSHLPAPRVLLIGLLVAAIFAALDHWLLNQLQHQRSATTGPALTMGMFVVQIGLLGWLCGRFLEHPWWRWGAFVWGWVLIDLQLFNTSGFAVSELANVMFAAQIGFAMIWAILGTTAWTIRLPACASVAALLIFVMPPSYYYGRLPLPLPLQMLALAGLCLALRWRRFRVTSIAPSSEPAGERARQMQFGIRHVLIWTTSLAIVLGVLRALDLLSLPGVTAHLKNDRSVYLSTGLLMAAAYIVSLWAALGSGSLWLRLPVLILTLAAIGMTAALLGWYASLASVFQKLSSFPRLWNDPVWQYEFWHYRAKPIVSVPLAGSFLAASLVILRVLGFRLARPIRLSSTAPAARLAAERRQP